MPNSFEYMKQQVAQLERIRAETAHEHHILEFRAMCAKMINEAIPEIKRQVEEDLLHKFKMQDKAEQPKQQKMEAVFSPEQVKSSLFDAIKRAFRR